MSPKYPVTDWTVSYDDALQLLEQLKKLTGKQMLAELIDDEPAIVGVALAKADNLGKRLTRRGVQPAIVTEAMEMALHMQAVIIHLNRMGARKLWDDLIEPETGGSHDQR